MLLLGTTVDTFSNGVVRLILYTWPSSPYFAARPEDGADFVVFVRDRISKLQKNIFSGNVALVVIKTVPLYDPSGPSILKITTPTQPP